MESSPPGPPRDLALALASQAVRRGNPLAALSVLGPREDGHALGVRGIALAQVGQHLRAQRQLDRAAAIFEAARQPLFRARALAACAEVRAARHDFDGAERRLREASRLLVRLGDRANAAWTRIVLARLLGLERRAAEAGRELDAAEALARTADAELARAALELVRAERAWAGLRFSAARDRLRAALRHARASGNRLLASEIERSARALIEPAARWTESREVETLSPLGLETRLARCGRAVIVDGLSRQVRAGTRSVDLRSRPVLFALASELAAAHPGPADAPELFAAVFGFPLAHESGRYRLRVELARLRAALAGIARVSATAGPRPGAPGGGWRLDAGGPRVVLIRPLETGPGAQLKALLGDGAVWSCRSLGRALGMPVRSAQRLCTELTAQGELRPFGAARARVYALARLGDRIAPSMLLLHAGPP